MGTEVDREHFTEADYERFAARLDDALTALAEVVDRPDFGLGPASLGAELELALVDDAGRPLPLNRTVLTETIDRRVTLEVDRFNLEINARPLPLAGRPLHALGADLTDALGEVSRAAARHGGRIVTIGILPTLVREDLAGAALTDSARYRALSAGLRRLRDEPFEVVIEGADRLAVRCDDVTLQGANTSFQLHLRVPPAAFARTFNAAQIATAPALAVAGNSPLFLGHRLWDETRIALFRQSVDDRLPAPSDEWRPARVSFGHGWVRRGALELFRESVALHPALLPIVGTEDPMACVRRGGVPRLDELRLHHGTVWRWNRAVYDASAGGHLRIELRALPAGPTVADMLANAAFLLGLTLALAPDADDLVCRLTFGQARRNFYEAARRGLDAALLWPTRAAPSPQPQAAVELIPRLLPTARRGLVDAGVDPAEADALLATIAARVETGRTGARWQRAMLDALAGESDPYRLLLERYIAAAASGHPIHEWTIAG